MATAELVAVTRTPSALELTFADTPDALLMIASDQSAAVQSGQAEFRDNRLVADLSAGPGEMVFDDGTRLAWTTTADAPKTVPEQQVPGSESGATAVVLSRFAAEAAELFAGSPATVHAEAPPLEALGVYAGRGRYRATVPAGCAQVLIHGAADILSLSIRPAAGEPLPLGTLTPFGAAAVVDLPAGNGGEFSADVEIWGHSNFDDARLPALSLGALRGTGTVMAVVRTTDVSSLWRVHGGGQWAEPGRALRGFGGWSSSRLGVGIGYRKTLSAPAEEENYLHFAGLTSPISVCVGSLAPAVVVPENPYLRLPRETIGWDIDVTFPHDPSHGPGPVTLLSGVLLQDWSVQALPQEGLDAMAQAAGVAAVPAEGPAGLPREVPAGSACWLSPDLADLESGRGYFLKASGSGLMISAWLDGVRLGRVMPGVQGDSAAPRMSGGDPGVIWLPAPMMKPQARLTLLLESRGTSAGRLESLLCERAHS